MTGLVARGAGLAAAWVWCNATTTGPARQGTRRERQLERQPERDAGACDGAADARAEGADGQIAWIARAGRDAGVGERRERRTLEEERQQLSPTSATHERRAILQRRRCRSRAVHGCTLEAAHLEGAASFAHSVDGDDLHRRPARAAHFARGRGATIGESAGEAKREHVTEWSREANTVR